MTIQFSIIIPTYRGKSLLRTLDSIVNLNYPIEKFECLVCDNSSSSKISRIVKDYSKKYPFIKYVSANKKKGAYFARNIGVKESKGDILCFIGDDCTISENWLQELEREFEDRNLSLVKTKLEAGYDNIWDITLNKKHNFYFEKYRYFGIKSIVFAGDSFAVRKYIFDEVGFFEEVLRGGDVLFSQKFIERNYKFSYLKNSPIKHYGIKNFSDFAKRAFAYGFGAVVTDMRDEVFEKISFFDNIKFRFIETPKYIGGYKNLMPLFVYTFFNLIGRSCAKLKIFKENPVK